MDVDGGLVSIVLSVIAIVASGLTTYLTIFNARYRAVAVVADAPTSVQTSSSRAGGRLESVGYRVIFAPTLILSNRGTRPVAATQFRLFRSRDVRRCVMSDESFDAALEERTFLLEAGSVRHVRPEFVLPLMTDDFATKSETWCLAVALIDHEGRRTDAAIRLATFDFAIEPSPDGEEAAPVLRAKIDHPRGPQLLAARGWLSGRG